MLVSINDSFSSIYDALTYRLHTVYASLMFRITPFIYLFFVGENVFNKDESLENCWKTLENKTTFFNRQMI
jgi:hypothetical protein